MSDMIQIIVNGSKVSVLFDTSIENVLQQGEMSVGRFIVVANGDVVPKSLYANTALNQGDVFETIAAISGG